MSEKCGSCGKKVTNGDYITNCAGCGKRICVNCQTLSDNGVLCPICSKVWDDEAYAQVGMESVSKEGGI